MRTLRCLLLAFTVAILPGCFTSDGGDCLRPIDEFIPPQTKSADGAGGGVRGGGQCAAWVQVGDIDYNWYRDMRAEGWRFHIDAGELDPFGEATEANSMVHPVSEAAVWSVRGLDPDDFLVMRSAEDGEFFFLVQGGGQSTDATDAVLCRYAIGLERTVRERCAGGAQPPSADAS